MSPFRDAALAFGLCLTIYVIGKHTYDFIVWGVNQALDAVMPKEVKLPDDKGED